MKKFNVFLLGTLVLLCSCVNKEYDLNKDLSTDVKIEGNKITLPFGSLKAITLDSLIDVDDIEVLEATNGAYNIKKAEEIDPIEETIDPIEISIEGKSESVAIEFTDAEIKSVRIDAPTIDPATFDVPAVSFDELNDKLPKFSSTAKDSVKSKEIDNLLELFNSGMADNFLPITIPIKETFNIEPQTVNVAFGGDGYKLPEQVKSIENITLATAGDATANGTLLKATIKRPRAMEGLDSKVDFKIEFPKNFVLGIKDGVDQNECYTLLDKSTIEVKDLKIEDEYTFVEFYIQKIVDLNNEEITKNGVIQYNDFINYELYYKVDGELLIEKGEEFTYEDFHFQIDFGVELAFSDVEGTTNDIDVPFEPINMNFNGSFDGLDSIKRINYVDFKDEESYFIFHTDMNELNTLWKNFNLKQGSELKIKFPDGLVFNDGLSRYPGKGGDVIYDPENNAFYIKSFKNLTGKWELALDRLNIYTDVIDNKADIDVTGSVSVINRDDSGQEKTANEIWLGSTHIESLSKTLDEIGGTKEAKFTIEEGRYLYVDDASVDIKEISSDLTETSEFSFEEEVEEDIKSIQSIEFENEVAVTFKLEVEGLDIDMDVNLDMDVKLPSFLSLDESTETSDNVDIQINDGTLKVNTIYNPKKEKEIIIGLKCSGLDFKNKEKWSEDGLTPEIIDEKSYLKYDGEIEVTGKATIEGREFKASDLDLISDEIKLNINYEIDDITVKTFHGKYDGKIDGSVETIDLDLGDELDFLKDGGHTIDLAAPQIEINLNNSVGVPVDVELIIVGKDDNGVEIKRIKTPTLNIDAADYDEKTGAITPKDTKLFLTSDESLFIGDESYKNYVVDGLNKLLNDKIPSTIELTIEPKVNTSTVHHINITEPIKFSGDYSVFIPLRFNELNIKYEETMDELHEDLGDAVEKLANVSLDINMDVISTLPLGLEITAQCYDVVGNLIEEGITIEPVTIKAGRGGSINDPELSESAQKLVLKVRSTGRSLSSLDQIVLTARATTDQTVGGVDLKTDQGVKISNVVIDIEGDIETEL